MAFRFNPLVGGGTIAALAVSGPKSKFGVPFTDDVRKKLIECFRRLPFLDGLHVHVGSQGFSLDQLCQGAEIAVRHHARQSPPDDTMINRLLL